MFDQYFAWLRKANGILLTNHNIATHQVFDGEWRFDWYQSWVAGCPPYQAVEDSYAELRDRGILDEVAQRTVEQVDD